jgi:hypothetical protein
VIPAKLQLGVALVGYEDEVWGHPEQLSGAPQRDPFVVRVPARWSEARTA